VHGAYHGAWCWDLLIPELVERGHTVVAVDLPITDPTAGAEAYASTVLDEISELSDPVVVGHSMGGLVVPLVAASRPVRRMVFLAAFLPEPGSSVADQRAREPLDPEIDFSATQFTHIGDGVFEVGEETATEMFFYDVDPEIRAWALAQLRPQSYRFMDEITPLRSWPDCRSAYIVCAGDHAVNAAWERRAAVERLGVEPHEIEGGHSPFLSRPSRLADILDAAAA